MKKWGFACFLLLLCLALGTAVAEGEYKYRVTSDTTCTITDYTGSDTVVTIPGELDGYRVTGIGDLLFEGNRTVKSIVVPDGVETIGGGAFGFCSNLTSVKLPNSVKSIGSWAFAQCISLKEINIPAGVEAIEDYTFLLCWELTSMTIPDSVKWIGTGAFSQCSMLAAVSMPASLTSIGKEAFSFCEKLKAVTIPAGVTRIEEDTFWMCTNLASVKIEGNLTSIGANAFSECGKIKSLELPDSIEYLGERSLPGQALVEFSSNDVIETYCKEHHIQYKCTGTTVQEFTNVDDKIDWIIATYITPDMSEYRKALTLYDWLCANVAYDYQWYNTGVTQNKYGVSGKGALLGGTAVCDGYSYAYMWLLEAVGIEAVRVTGEARYSGEGHAWNLAKINGKWYQFDATWDESGDGARHDFFGLTDEVMRSSHAQNSHLNTVCDSYEANYFYRSGALDESLADMQQKVLALIAGGEFSGTATVLWEESRGSNAMQTLALIAQRKIDWPMNGSVTITPTNHIYMYDDGCFTDFDFTFTPGRVPGDANTDGLVDAQDILLVQQYVAGWGVSINTGNADMNDDGQVDMKDLNLILQ